MQDLQTKRMIGGGYECGGLYYYDASTPSPLQACLAADPYVWHYRLGHPVLPKLKSFVNVPASLRVFKCEACELGKHHRISFPSRVNKRSPSPFDVVHSDVWGSSLITTTIGFQYFVTFIDDHSRMT